jgi:CHAT domain-containing protein/TolB-like protein
MQNSGSPPIHLTILRKGDVNIVDLAEMGSVIPRSETQVEGAFLQEIVDEASHLGTPGYLNYATDAAYASQTDHAVQTNQASHNSYARKGFLDTSFSLPPQQEGPAIQDLQRLGGLIFSHLLTEPARKRIQTAPPSPLYLRLDEQLLHVPWELCYDGADFLVNKFQVGRQVITSAPLSGSQAQQAVPDLLKVLLVVDPTESLPQAAEEADRLCSLLDNVPGVEVTLMGGRGVRKVPLLSALQTHHVVHFAGHSQYDAACPSKSGWRLHEGLLTAGELSKLSHPPLLVFSNSCEAGATAQWSTAHYEGQAFGIGSAFLLAGVKNYIGTFWIVQDEESVHFSAAFYRSLAAGQSLGEALSAARQDGIQQRGWNSLSWASYMLYGDPAFTLLRPDPQEFPLESPLAFPLEARPAFPPAEIPTEIPIPVKPYPSQPTEDTHPATPRQSGLEFKHLRHRLFVSLALILCIAVAYSLWTPVSKPDSLLVMKFQPLRPDPSLDWMSEAIRESLNAQLSTSSGLKVYSKEHIEFHESYSSDRHEGLLGKLKALLAPALNLLRLGKETEMEIARRLGISKVISGSFLTLSNKLRIEARIVDVDSGVQEAATHVEGDQYEENFFRLTTDLANKIIAFLKVPDIRPEEIQDAEDAEDPAATSDPDLQIYKMLLEAEGGLPKGHPEQQPHNTPDKPRQTHSQPTGEGHSSVFRVWEWLGTIY